MVKTKEEIFREAKSEADWMCIPFHTSDVDWKALAINSLSLWNDKNKRYCWHKLSMMGSELAEYLKEHSND